MLSFNNDQIDLIKLEQRRKTVREKLEPITRGAAEEYLANRTKEDIEEEALKYYSESMDKFGFKYSNSSMLYSHFRFKFPKVNSFPKTALILMKDDWLDMSVAYQRAEALILAERKDAR